MNFEPVTAADSHQVPPARTGITAVRRAPPRFQGEHLAAHVAGRVEHGTGATGDTRKESTVVNGQTRDTAPFIQLLTGWRAIIEAARRRCGNPTRGGIEPLQGCPLRSAIVTTDFRARNRAAVQLTVIDDQAIHFGTVDA